MILLQIFVHCTLIIDRKEQGARLQINRALSIAVRVKDVLHSGQIQKIPLRLVELIDVFVPQVYIDRVPLAHFAFDYRLHYYLVVFLAVLLSILNRICKIPALMTIPNLIRRNPILITQVLNLLLLNLVDGFLNKLTVTFSNQKRRYLYRATLAVIAHARPRTVLRVHHDGHDRPEILNVSHLFNEVAISAVHHNDEFVTVKTAFFQVVVIEV